jgi:hypothetical protein
LGWTKVEDGGTFCGDTFTKKKNWNLDGGNVGNWLMIEFFLGNN